jgi:predicted N-acetyltransferase YhbS
MVIIRNYDEQNDSQAVGVLIADTYRNFNLDFASPAEQEKLLGPFRHAGSDDPLHQEAITRVLRTELVFVAEDEGQIVGVLRCRPGLPGKHSLPNKPGKPSLPGCLQSLFVRQDHHRQGIARRLVERCERELAQRGSRVVRLAATLYAIPFYEAVGYKKSTGIRSGWSFDGEGLQYQPMKKKLERL